MHEKKPGKWHHRGYIPHFNSSDVIQFVTYKLYDSIPMSAEEVISKASDLHETNRLGMKEAYEQVLDKGYGSCLLSQPDIAQFVIDSWIYHHTHKYHLLAWIVMPNHVHVMLRTLPSFQLSRVIQSWKSFTAKRIKNAVPDEKIWGRGYWDHFIRNDDDFYTTLNYIHENPVRAGLVKSPEEWKFSSYSSWKRHGDLSDDDWKRIFGTS